LDVRGRKWGEAEEYCIMKSFITFMLHQLLLRVIKSKRIR